MPTLRFTAGVGKKGNRVEASIVPDDKNEPVGRRMQFDPDSDRSRILAARAVAVPLPDFTRYYALFERGENDFDIGDKPKAPQEAAQPPRYVVSDITTGNVVGRTDCFVCALRVRSSSAGDNPDIAASDDDTHVICGYCGREVVLIEAPRAAVSQDLRIGWEGTDHTACLDVDWHYDAAPNDRELMLFAASLEPRSAWHWISRSGGLHCLYHRVGETPAADLAVCALLSVRERFPTSTQEIKSDTRKPPQNRSAVRGEPTGPSTALRRLWGQRGAADVDVAHWLESKGFAVGGRYPHTLCPVAPSDRARANSDPVCVYEDHVFCYICRADGTVRGGLPGYFPFAALLDVPRAATLLETCARNLTHWAHARHIVAQTVEGDALGRMLYAAVLRAMHGADDPRIPAAFGAGANLLRFVGYWGDVHAAPVKLDRGSAILARLPAAQYTAEGKVAVSAERVEWLSQTTDLTGYGYPALLPVWGAQLTQFQEQPRGRVSVVLQSERLRGATMRDRWPRYVPPSRRMSIDAAWNLLEQVYPRVCRNAVVLMLAAKGCAEHCAGLHPMVFFTGPTGAGKTGSVHIAEAIAGDTATAVAFHPEFDRLCQRLMRAKLQGSFAVFDEFLKGARRAKQEPDVAMEAALNFTPSTLAHVLYVGAVPLGALPALIWTDTYIPPELASHAQIGRRIVHVPLESEMHWEASTETHGLTSLARLRVEGAPCFVEAANAVLSWVIDEYFPAPEPTDFARVAESLGFRKLRESDSTKEKRETIRRFFAALLSSAPLLSGPDAERWPAEGLRLIDLNRQSDEVVKLWEAVADPGMHDSRALRECDLQEVLVLRLPTKLDVRHHGRHVAVRFVGNDNKTYNEALK